MHFSILNIYPVHSTVVIREYFDHFQSVESADKRREVRRSALPEAKCPLRNGEMDISVQI